MGFLVNFLLAKKSCLVFLNKKDSMYKKLDESIEAFHHLFILK